MTQLIQIPGDEVSVPLHHGDVRVYGVWQEAVMISAVGPLTDVDRLG